MKNKFFFLSMLLCFLCLFTGCKKNNTINNNTEETITTIDQDGNTVLKTTVQNGKTMYFILKKDYTAEVVHKAYFYFGPINNENSEEWRKEYISEDVIIPESLSYFGNKYIVNTIGNMAFGDCPNITTIDLPPTTTTIRQYAFLRCYNLVSLNIPSSVTMIEDYAFFKAGITSITIPESINNLNYILYGCEELVEVYLPKTMNAINGDEFPSCYSLLSINIHPDNEWYKSVDGVLFTYNLGRLVRYPSGREGSYSIPNSVTWLGSASFSSCQNLTNLTIPSSVIGIEAGPFECPNLKNIEVEEGNSYYKSIDGVLFNIDGSLLICYPIGKSELTYTVPDNVITIQPFAFADCLYLQSITLPNTIVNIGGGAFYGCNNIQSITFPNTIVDIGSSSFSNCAKLHSIICMAQNPPIIWHSFSSSPLQEIKVPQNSVELYKTAEGWSEYADIIVGI